MITWQWCANMCCGTCDQSDPQLWMKVFILPPNVIMKCCCHKEISNLNLNVSPLHGCWWFPRVAASSLVHTCQVGFGQICYKTFSLQSHRHHFVTYLVLLLALSNPNQFTLQPLSNIKEFHLVQLKIYVSVNLVTFSTLTASFFPSQISALSTWNLVSLAKVVILVRS